MWKDDHSSKKMSYYFFFGGLRFHVQKLKELKCFIGLGLFGRHVGVVLVLRGKHGRLWTNAKTVLRIICSGLSVGLGRDLCSYE